MVIRYNLFALAVSAALGANTAAQIPLTVRAGYHVIHSYPGLTPPDSLFNLTSQGLVGGIILFGENVDSDNISSTAATVERFQDAYTKSPYYDGTPLLILTDQEGGQVVRLPGGPTNSAKQVGESAEPASAAATAGQEAAEACQAAGVNGNLAPVNGVYRIEGNFLDQYERSFGNTSSLVRECTSSFVQTQQAKGVLSTAKHFPGLGAAGANEDTDAEPVTINLDLDTLREVDEVPFNGSIAAGVDMVMPSWAIYPALDDTYPAGLSSKWIQDELRGRLGFKGVTVSDAIEAGALSKGGFGADDGARAVLATSAGMDLILASGRNATQGAAVVEALVDGYHFNAFDTAAFDAGTERIVALRKRLTEGASH
jgi:beta-glucosidase-like glycosyl hydrolase